MTSPQPSPNPSTGGDGGQPQQKIGPNLPQPPATGGGQQNTPPAQQSPATGGQQQPTGDETLGPAGLRALQAERDARAAAERERDALRSESTQLQQERVARQQAEQQLAAVQAERLRLQVAQQHGIPPEAMVLLTATTEQDLAAQAAQVVALRGAQQQQNGTPPPAFVPNPGQAAGNAHPPAAHSVELGRQLYDQHKARKSTL
jgi:hypothetical protein